MAWCAVCTSGIFAQGAIDLENRPVAEVRLEGLDQVSEQLVRNQIRMKAGRPYDSDTVSEDVVRINHLGRFSTVRAEVTPRNDGSLVLTYVLREWPLLEDVQVIGNRKIDDQRIQDLVLLGPGDPIDPFLIERGVRLIEDEYRDEGYFVADVELDEDALEEQRVLIFMVREGPRVRIKEIRFRGAASIEEEELRREVESETFLPIFREGRLSREQLELDAAAVRELYRERGYLDAQVGRRIDLSPDQTGAVVTFLVEEGPRYLVDSVQIEGARRFSQEQVRQHLDLGPGDIYSTSAQQQSAQRVRLLYGRIGYIDTRVNIDRLFHEDRPRVDLRVTIEEQPEPAIVGKVEVRGNELTKTRVVLREVRGMTPGRRFDLAGVQETRRRLERSRFFGTTNLSILGDEDDQVRDVLLEVDEQNTGSISFGVGLSSDVGVLGSIDLTQRNFDITDIPESPGEFFAGRSFRGAGQSFRLALQPGNEFSNYSVSFSEPHLLNSDYSISTSAFFRTREFDDFDEQRLGGTLGFGRRFGDVWSGSVQARAANVDIGSISNLAPVDIFDVEGESLLTTLGLGIERDTVDNRFDPQRGSLLSFGIERAGLIGGDFDYTRLTGTYNKYWTLQRDFLDRPSVLSFRLEGGWIVEEDESPVFERFFAGGQRSFRGFQFRGVGPRGVTRAGTLSDDAVGGDWMLLLGLQYEFPLVGDTLRGVVFTDQGTVQEDVDLDQWRVAIGTGVRIKVPFVSQVPFALDFAIPLRDQENDETTIFSFDIDLPLQ
ncbi:MAG: outer membrane protein assembly factor BamA [Phycisphaeraceae bacterium]